MSMETWELLNCDRCGSSAVCISYDAMYEDLPMIPTMPWFAKCLSCGAIAFGETPARAVEAWNNGHVFGGSNED